MHHDPAESGQLSAVPADPAARRPLPPESPAHPAGPGTAKGAGAPGGGAGKVRDPFFDNAKYLAIVLVAIAHSWEPLLASSRPLRALYLTVYAFHMPAFIIISGYFSRTFTLGAPQVRKLITGVAVPYVIFQYAYTLFARLAGPDPVPTWSVIDPWWLNWFLVALFVWRLTTPLWRLVRWPLPLALAFAVLGSVSPEIGADLDLQRVLQFLPYFVLGLLLRPHHFALLAHKWPKIVAAPVLLAGLGAAWWLAPHLPYAWLYHRESAQDLDAPWWSGPLMTFALFAASLVLTAAFLALVPRRTAWCTRLGAGTLGGYLLHGFLIKAATWGGWYDGAFAHSAGGALLFSAGAGVAVTLLCTPPVRRAFRWALEPRLGWAFGDTRGA
ncbi:acyltransferase family protein [Streptomyces sp. SID11385]|uniref:acyltransferase family protein n=1 Tax=Streptomyces sp. SID11385 TaxID=2706031 RepID=UPI0013C7636E|nr:acyltransferase family protein [Streptomyces sp. SID11385]NEA38718.1 acyltransferase family protein [Streptomyces sp. SID11385]